MSIFQDIYNSFFYNQRYLFYLDGLKVTILISLFSVLLGTVLGFLAAFMRLSKNKVINGIAGAYIDIIRGTPTVIQLLIISNVLFFGGVTTSIITLGINSGAYVAEIVRGGILSVDKGQMEAGRSLGLNKYQTMRYIILPQAIKNIIPALGNEFIVLIKETAIVGYIAVSDLTKASQIVISRTGKATSLFISAFIYFVIIKLITYLIRMVEKKLRVSDER